MCFARVYLEPMFPPLKIPRHLVKSGPAIFSRDGIDRVTIGFTNIHVPLGIDFANAPGLLRLMRPVCITSDGINIRMQSRQELLNHKYL